MAESEKKWGYLRETAADAEKAGKDPATGLHRSGLDCYLSAIFPETNDWIHDKSIQSITRRRPDYRSESLKLIVEFDGTQHYTDPDVIVNDIESTKLYEESGYKVVRIPYFIQLTNRAVKSLFNVDVAEPLFDESIPSLSVDIRNSPAYCCPAGITRMAQEFLKFPEQYKVNIEFLKKQNNEFKSGVSLLEKEYLRLQQLEIN
jgi:hypothetical protein